MTADPPPAPPWVLHGDVCLGAWFVRADRVPAPPAGWRLLKVGPWAVAGAVFARYGPGGTLAYNEFGVGLLLRRRLRIALTIPWMWVDREASAAGGRQHWAIPKQLARFSAAEGARRVETSGDELSDLTFARSDFRAPLLPFPLDIVQPSGGKVVEARARFSGWVRMGGRCCWRSSVLEALDAPARPLLFLWLERARLEIAAARTVDLKAAASPAPRPLPRSSDEPG